MTEAIMQAVAGVEADGEGPDPGAGQPDQGEEPDAMPEGPVPGDDPGHEGGEDSEQKSDPKNSVLSWASRVPDGSHLDFDRRDWWDPDGGGEARLAFHLSDLKGDGVGYPNGVGVVVAAAEIYVSRVLGRGDRGDQGDGAGVEEAPDAEEVARDTAEAYV